MRKGAQKQAQQEQSAQHGGDKAPLVTNANPAPAHGQMEELSGVVSMVLLGMSIVGFPSSARQNPIFFIILHPAHMWGWIV